MTDMNYDGIGITVENYVAVVEIQRGPNNFFDTQMIKDLADAFGKMEASKGSSRRRLVQRGQTLLCRQQFRQ